MTSKYSLAISTINNLVSACIFENTTVIYKFHDPVQDNKSVSRLFKVIEHLFKISKLSYNDIAEIYVSVGPGSFTAIRISLAFASGLNIAKDIKIYGISNLQLMAYLMQLTTTNISQGYFLLDAQREQIFMQAMDVISLKELSECELIDYSYLHKPLDLPVVADSHLYQKLIETMPELENLNIACVNYNAANAIDIGQCGIFLKSHSLTKPITPFYVRLPDAKPNNPNIITELKDL